MTTKTSFTVPSEMNLHLPPFVKEYLLNFDESHNNVEINVSTSSNASIADNGLSAVITKKRSSSNFTSSFRTKSTSAKKRQSTVASFDSSEIALIRESLLEWYHKNRRKLPWRGDVVEGYSQRPVKSAYGTWVSEIMLQQTRVETVIAYWFRWMDKFPSVSELARATPDEVNSLWTGLGYYRRAQQLLKGAVKIEKDYSGVVPDTVPKLLDIPGIGPYTAGAISSIAYGHAEPLVDGNVIRVLSRTRAIREDPSSEKEKRLWEVARELVHRDQPGDFNQALMELGATLCTPKSPECHRCPISTVCRAKALVDLGDTLKARAKTEMDEVKGLSDIEDIITKLPSDVTEFPRKVLKKPPKNVVLSVCVMVCSEFTASSTPLDHEIEEKKKKSKGTMKLTLQGDIPFLQQLEICNHSTASSAAIGVGREESCEDRYLLMKRPSSGLLAGQWEFPNVALPESASIHQGDEEEMDEDATVGVIAKKTSKASSSDGKAANDLGLTRLNDEALLEPLPAFFRNIMGIHISSLLSKTAFDKTRRKKSSSAQPGGKKGTINSMFRTESSADDINHKESHPSSSPCESPAIEPILHIFSHQRHLMHITHRRVSCRYQSIPGASISSQYSWRTTEEEPREARWMTRAEIEEVGLTTGMKKVFQAVSAAKSDKEKKKEKSDFDEQGLSKPPSKKQSKKPSLGKGNLSNGATCDIPLSRSMISSGRPPKGQRALSSYYFTVGSSSSSLSPESSRQSNGDDTAADKSSKRIRKETVDEALLVEQSIVEILED